MIDYYDYIKSEEWFRISDPVRARNNGRCECCKMRFGREVHHRTYKNLGRENPDDLIHLCKWCHEYVHGKIKKIYVWASRRAFLELLKKERETRS